ncbi:putative polysaccharide biosynthesis protein [Actinoplanes missouriensis 431]|uniref:Putative polysaccharide biosynthesis protein n=1 Tax=Actinoplanes missouriensis (strain ATCC 14538 / DSM 43046 / CBS 188.64 / JCM 3121 / NBRC 102363 / NCIMB 12654 / NRRL B-3342 / UNCC 431) TaxID=512565 RepID=I0HD01_ACTM4|nr:polysaccharide biosynthesis protein [Actinoplanes missouriensis]BAL90888.1 putative polysaccharide biosynthesis protein [Actinoplanes missouriensis 431]
MPVRAWNLRAAATDAAAWIAGLFAAILTRYGTDLDRRRLTGYLLAAALAVVLQLAIGHTRHLYRGRYPYASFEEVRAAAITTGSTAAVLLALDMLLSRRPVPPLAPLAGGAVALVLMLAVRYAQRARRQRRRRPDQRTAAPVLLFGAGEAGTLLVRSMLHDPNSRYLPVGLIDDDPRKRRLHISGVPVLGARDDLPAVLTRTGAGLVVFAVANAEAELVRAVRDRTVAAGATFKVVPSMSELMDHPVAVDDIRDVQVTDLLGRHQIETDLTAIAGYLTGKRVLVTGAGGSIGSELCRQIHRFQPAELMMLDRDESALQAVQLSLDPLGRLDDPAVILADLRDAERIRTIFRTRRPQVVFHAAALKHLALLQRHPGEALKTNVLGTLNVLDAAGEVERFVNISTDKAADPTSVLGYSKRITERLTAWTASRRPGMFLSVRFGNVLGSRGSVFTTFSAQIADGGPVTVTHPDVTRYFMTTQEAVHLVIQAAAIGRDGEALVLEMGDPVRIAEVARQMVQLARSPVEIRYTGLRPGEKLAETLFGAGERDDRPFHPLISHVAVPPLDAAQLFRIDPAAGPDQLIAQLDELTSRPVTAPRPDSAVR